jgi:hypothetical protein
MNEQQLRDKLEESMEVSKSLFDALTSVVCQLGSYGSFPDIDRLAFEAGMKYIIMLEDKQ